MAKKASEKVAAAAKQISKLKLKSMVDPHQWDEVATRSLAANSVLTLGVNALLDNEPLKRAFEAFDLEPADPRHWRFLLNEFARAHFSKGKEGAPQKWTRERKAKLSEHLKMVYLTQSHMGGDLGTPKIAVCIKKALPEVYSDTTADQIYRQILEILKGNL